MGQSVVPALRYGSLRQGAVGQCRDCRAWTHLRHRLLCEFGTDEAVDDIAEELVVRGVALWMEQVPAVTKV